MHRCSPTPPGMGTRPCQPTSRPTMPGLWLGTREEGSTALHRPGAGRRQPATPRVGTREGINETASLVPGINHTGGRGPWSGAGHGAAMFSQTAAGVSCVGGKFAFVKWSKEAAGLAWSCFPGTGCVWTWLFGCCVQGTLSVK